MKTRIAIIGLLLALAVSSICHGQISSEKEREIRKLLAATGTTKAVTGMMSQMLGQFRTALPQVPKQFWTDFEKEMDVDELIRLMMPVYDKHLSTEDLKAANAFYSTPAGKRLAEKTPVMTSEGFEVGRKWGEAKGRLVAQRLKEKGLDK
jgi:hypothetical protein